VAEIKHGTVVVTIPDELEPPEQAGNLSPEQVQRIPKAKRGLGLVCEATAEALEKAGSTFTPPSDVTAVSLRESGSRAEGIDQVILDLEVVLNKLRQANLLFDAVAWEQIRKMNDQVKTQGKHVPELLVMFKPLLDFFARGPRPAGPTAPPAAP
jgi:hypothetical protein